MNSTGGLPAGFDSTFNPNSSCWQRGKGLSAAGASVPFVLSKSGSFGGLQDAQTVRQSTTAVLMLLIVQVIERQLAHTWVGCV